MNASCTFARRARSVPLVWLVAVFSLPIALQRATSARAAGADIEWVTVGDPGNPPDAATGRGAVARVFQIARHEVTVEQYAAFLAAVAARDPHALWNAGQKIDRGGKDGAYTYSARTGHEREPVMNVSFIDAMRFANWLHHQQEQKASAGAAPTPPTTAVDATQETETGAYTIAAGGGLAARSPDARAWIPSEDEWYKAAYHHPHAAGGPPGGYWRFPTKSDFAPALGAAGDTGPNLASFLADGKILPNGAALRGYDDVMPVGSFPGSASYYGTLDQAGNAWEWVETTIFDTQRIMRGGSMCATYEKLLPQVRSNARPIRRYRDTGFRVARAAPPAPAAPPAAASPAFVPAAAPTERSAS